MQSSQDQRNNEKARMKNKIDLQSMQHQKMSEGMKYESGRNQRCGGNMEGTADSEELGKRGGPGDGIRDKVPGST
jgi:hypothetical protein